MIQSITHEQCAPAKTGATPAMGTPELRMKERDSIEALTAEFLAKGGEVVHAPIRIGGPLKDKSAPISSRNRPRSKH